MITDIQKTRSSPPNSPSDVQSSRPKKRLRTGDNKTSEISQNKLSPKEPLSPSQNTQFQTKTLNSRVQPIPSPIQTGMDAFDPFLFTEESEAKSETEVTTPTQEATIEEQTPQTEASGSENKATGQVQSEEEDEEVDEEEEDTEMKETEELALRTIYERGRGAPSLSLSTPSYTTPMGGITVARESSAVSVSSSTRSAGTCTDVALKITLVAALSYIFVQLLNVIISQKK